MSGNGAGDWKLEAGSWKLEAEMMCDSKELIVGYVYDDLSVEERVALESHLSSCAECRTEVGELRATRSHLAVWSPPEPDLRFRIIRGGGAAAPAVPLRSRWIPAFAFAAAAVIVLAVAAAIANVELRYGSDGLAVRTGWASRPFENRPAQGAIPQQAPVETRAATPAVSADFVALDRRLREIESTLVEASTGNVQTIAAGRLSDAEMLRRVRQMLSEAEARQETAIAKRLLGVVRDFDRQRSTDIALIQQGLGQYQGLTNAEIARHGDMLNQLVRVATRQEK